jgi:hypothetical protein
MTKERMEMALEQLKRISKEDYAKVKALAAIVKPLRSVLHKTPDDYGMTGWRDIYFPSDDGIPLEGWYIPAKGEKMTSWSSSTTPCQCVARVSPATWERPGATLMRSRSTS